jgi:hypothetical protein
MQKTTRPDLYLAMLSSLLRDASHHPSLLIKLGFLIYIGESATTMRETIGYLMLHADLVSWVSVSPLFVFGGTALDRRFDEYHHAYGSTLHKDGFWGRSRTYACNVSRDLHFRESIEAARSIEKLFRRPEAFDRVFERKQAVTGVNT